MNDFSVVVSQQSGRGPDDAVVMPAELFQRLLGTAQEIHRAGLKSYGLLIAEPGTARYPFNPTDVIFLDPRKNRRNEPAIRAAFHAQGDYFRQYDDAGFVADPSELLATYRKIEASGREVVAPFHSHRRQPPNFSLIDYRLHNPAFAWHLIICLRDPQHPEVQPFRVHKQPSEFGISEHDARQDSELDYEGPEVEPLTLLVNGSGSAVRRADHQRQAPTASAVRTAAM